MTPIIMRPFRETKPKILKEERRKMMQTVVETAIQLIEEEGMDDRVDVLYQVAAALMRGDGVKAVLTKK